MFGINNRYEDEYDYDYGIENEFADYNERKEKQKGSEPEFDFTSVLSTVETVLHDDGTETEETFLTICSTEDELFQNEIMKAKETGKCDIVKTQEEVNNFAGGKKTTEDKKPLEELVKTLGGYKPDRAEKMMKEFDGVYVNDFNDYYHLSEAEQAKRIRNYAAFAKVRKQKSVYKDMVSFIKALRECFECLDAVAKDQPVYPPEEFKRKYYRGEIYINGLTLPKYGGKDAKYVDWRHVVEFALSDKDANEFLGDLPDDKPQVYNLAEMWDEEIKENPYLIQDWTDEEKELQIKDPEHAPGVVTYLSKKEMKELLKLPDMKDIMKMRRRPSLEDTYSFLEDLRNHTELEEMITNANIEEYCKAREKYYTGKKLTEEESIYIAGNIDDDDEYHRYKHKLDDYYLDKTMVNHNGTFITVREEKNLDIKNKLENVFGLNVRHLYCPIKDPKKSKKLKKKDAKRSESLKRKMDIVYRDNDGNLVRAKNKKELKQLRKARKKQLKNKCKKSRIKATAEFSLSKGLITEKDMKKIKKETKKKYDKKKKSKKKGNKIKSKKVK